MSKQVLHDEFQKMDDLMMKLGKIYRKGSYYVAMSFQGIDVDYDHDMVVTAREIRLALRKIPKEYGIILLNEYFNIKEQNWWYNLYSKHQYIKRKQQAISMLLDLLPSYCISGFHSILY